MTDKNVNIKVGVTGAEQATSKLGSLANFIKSRFVISLTDVSNLFNKLVSGFKSIVSSSAESEVALNRLASSMKNNGTYTKDAYDQAVKYSQEIQKVTTYNDEAVLSVQTLINSMTRLSGESLNKATSATADLAAGLGIDLESAARLLAKTIGSDINALGRYGISIDGAANSSARLESALRGVSQRFGGRAQAEAQTFTGKVEQLKNAFDDLKETLGSGVTNQGGLLDAFKGAIEGVDGYIKSIETRRIALMARDKRMIQTLGEDELKLLIENIDEVKILGFNKEKVLSDAQARLGQIQYYGAQDRNRQSQKQLSVEKQIAKDAETEKAKEAAKEQEKQNKEIAKQKAEQKKKDDAANLQAQWDFLSADQKARKEYADKQAQDAIELSDTLASISEDGGRQALEAIKKSINAKIDAWIAEGVTDAFIKAPMTFGASLAAVPGIIAAGAAGKATVNAVKFSQGGEFVSQGQSFLNTSGQGVMTGEAGKELHSVTPIGKSPQVDNRPTQINIQIDGRTIAKQMLPYLNAAQKGVI